MTTTTTTAKSSASERQPSPTSNGKSPRKLTQEELQKSTQRLATSTRTDVKLKPLVESVKLSKEESEKSVKRLYNDAVAAQKRRQDELTKKHELENPKPASGNRVLAQSEEQEAISRLYEKSVQHKQLVAAELEKKFSGEHPSKRLDGAAQQDVNQRLYTESISKHRDGLSKLYEKYIIEQDPKMVKRSAEELKAAAARLHTGEK